MTTKCKALFTTSSGITYACLRLTGHTGRHRNTGITWDDPSQPVRTAPLSDEELAAYHAKCDAVASKLYSLDFHYAPWEEASEKERLKYRQKAHLARVWWNLEVNQF